MTHLLEKETPFIFSKECIEAFETLKMKLTQAPILVAPDWDLPFEIMCDASDFAVGAVLGQRKTKHFQPIHYASKTMTEAQAHFTTTVKAYKKHPSGVRHYKLVYGKACHLPIELEHKAYWALKHTNFDIKTAGDHRKVQLNELNELRDHAYENSLIYKEKTKRIHDSKIKNRVFNVGDRVLLFNSRLKIFSGKLKTRWSGPFTVTQVFPYGTVELSQNSGPNFKVNGHRLKHYFGGDIPTEDFPDCEDSRARSIHKSFTSSASFWESRLVEAIDSLVPLDEHLATFRGHGKPSMWILETDIQEQDKKKAKNKQSRARNGKDKVKPKPNKSDIETQMQRQEENVNMREAVDAGLVVTESQCDKSPTSRYK
ncbi:reverse transcriptase domain-containing protein [Tanacetum coccineum]|uniref:Reverse transcriptase domain-containing protein n=1 Tax=Tanacetum coccineum TaxID=301880 RepID=A0ABQ5GFE1_9ASTR